MAREISQKKKWETTDFTKEKSNPYTEKNNNTGVRLTDNEEEIGNQEKETMR